MDPAEVEQGFQQLGDYLMPVARGRLNNNLYSDQDVLDCVQESIVAIWKLLGNGKGPSKSKAFLAFARTVTVRKCIDQTRYDSRKIRSSSIDSIGVHETPTYKSTLMKDESLHILMEAIQNHAGLSKKDKSVLIGSYLLEKNDIELARELNATAPNIRLIRSRALTKIRNDYAFTKNLQNDFMED